MRDLTQVLADLRLDTKDSGTLWSDAEWIRCIKRSVQDVTRYVPYEKAYEQTLDVAVTDESFTTPAAQSLTAVVNAQSINVAAGNTLTIAGQPDIPRPLTITITDANDSTYEAVFTLKGLDGDGLYQTEDFHFVKGQSKTLVGKKYWKYVAEVELEYDSGSGAGDTASIGYGSHIGVWVNLANKPIRTTGFSADLAGTAFTMDTDYEVDYINGRIRLITGTTMAAATAYTVDYTKSKLGINIAAIIPELRRIVDVEYPANLVPQSFVSYSVWGNFLYIGSQRPTQSQEEMSDNKHIVIYYEAAQQPPSVVSPGSYPEALEEVVDLGAQAYALFMKSLQYEHQAVTDATALRSELDNTTAVHALAKAALVLAGTQLGAAVVAGLFTKVDVALDAIATAVGAAATALVKINSDSGRTYLTDADTALDAAAVALGLVPTNSLDKATTGAEAYLDTGDNYITTNNSAAQVAEKHAKFSESRVAIAVARVQQALGYVQEAGNRVAIADRYIQEATVHVNSANAYTNEVTVRLGESDRWSNAGRGYIEQANSYLTEIEQYLNEARLYAEAINADLVLADRFRTDAIERLNEFYSILKSKAEYRKRLSRVALHQPA